MIPSTRGKSAATDARTDLRSRETRMAQPQTDDATDEETALSPLVTERGRTTIASTVVSTIVGVTVRGVPGVYAVGGGASRALGRVRDVLPGTSSNPGSGVSVEVGETEAAVDLRLVVEYGVPIVTLAGDVREAVIGAVEDLTGLSVTEVNISVDDVHLPDGDEQGTS